MKNPSTLDRKVCGKILDFIFTDNFLEFIHIFFSRTILKISSRFFWPKLLRLLRDSWMKMSREPPAFLFNWFFQ